MASSWHAPAPGPATPLIYLVAGEQSGDAIGARLMAALRARCPGLRFAGIGGDAMQAAGLVPLFPMRELALMGLFEMLPRLRQLRRRRPRQRRTSRRNARPSS